MPLPYGAWSLEAMDAHGGWIASAEDLVRFTAALEYPERSRLLRPATVLAMLARPAGLAGFEENGKPRDVYYGLGWRVRRGGAAGREFLAHRVAGRHRVAAWCGASTA